MPILSVLVFIPAVAALVLMLLNVQDKSARVFTLVVGLIEAAFCLAMMNGFDSSNPGFQLIERVPWIPSIGLEYHLAVDGLSFLMIVLSVALLPLCTLCSWTYIGKRIKEFHVCLLIMTAACVGVFAAQDMILFYIFWEAMLVPMYLLIAIWGGPRRRYASIKFFLYTLTASTLFLVAIIGFRVLGGTFQIPELLTQDFPRSFQTWTFFAMALAFAVKTPMFPFHTWLPAAHVEAPSAGSVILASVLLKMGTYGFIRFCLGLCPLAAASYAPLFIVLSLASILYGGLIALGQTDIKKLIAYSSVAHMGFVTLGIFLFSQAGIEGALMVMLSHGITTGGLFMLVGAIYERSHSREIADNQGLGKYMPGFLFFMGLFSLASLGFPATNGFVGEALVFIAAFQDGPLLGMLAAPGALLAAAYMLKLLVRMAYGSPESPKDKKWLDLSPREWLYLAPLAVFVVSLGLAPQPALKTFTPTVAKVLERFHQKTAEAKPELPAALAAGLERKTAE